MHCGKNVLWKKSDAYQYLAVNKTKTISNSMDYIIRKQEFNNITARKCKSLNVGPNGSNVKCVIQTNYNGRKMD